MDPAIKNITIGILALGQHGGLKPAHPENPVISDKFTVLLSAPQGTCELRNAALYTLDVRQFYRSLRRYQNYAFSPETLIKTAADEITDRIDNTNTRVISKYLRMKHRRYSLTQIVGPGSRELQKDYTKTYAYIKGSKDNHLLISCIFEYDRPNNFKFATIEGLNTRSKYGKKFVFDLLKREDVLKFITYMEKSGFRFNHKLLDIDNWWFNQDNGEIVIELELIQLFFKSFIPIGENILKTIMYDGSCNVGEDYESVAYHRDTIKAAISRKERSRSRDKSRSRGGKYSKKTIKKR